ncbi:hypothetical protein Dip518_001413 [Parelusimicrobium proximum]|uniref:hypothetical protein n=1 Tax=Parelusimicrobium proximum TaxID=3228953 RepID=UPI003D16AD60
MLNKNNNTVNPQDILAATEAIYKDAQPASLDTVILCVEDDFELCKGHHFRNIGIGRQVYNVKKEDKLKGIYRPRFSIDKYQLEGYLYIVESLKMEFSVPKLVHGNNLTPVTKADLPIIWKRLQDELKVAGVNIKLDTLRAAVLRRIDIGKNFTISHRMSITKANFEISRAIKRFPKSSIGDMSYENGGQGIKIFNGAETWQVYDKVKDFERSFASSKRAFDKDYYPQKQLMENLQSQKAQILRMESQFTGYSKIKQILGSSSEKSRFTLEDVLFNANLEEIVFSRWKKITAIYGQLPYDSSESEIVLGLLKAMDKPSALKAFAALGWCQYANKVGRETLITMLTPILTRRQMDYFVNSMGAECKPIAKTSEVITFINKHFEAHGVNTGDKNKGNTEVTGQSLL